MVLDGLAFPVPAQVEGGTMIRAQPGAGKAQGDVDGGMEVHQLQRNQPLVMVRGQHGVIVPFHGIPVHAVRDGRPVKCSIRMDRPQPFHGRGNDVPVLIAESAVFPGVGVQGCRAIRGRMIPLRMQKSFSRVPMRTSSSVSSREGTLWREVWMVASPTVNRFPVRHMA